MKKIFLNLSFVLISTLAFAQVGIGTKTPAASSILDLTATDKAFLLPRVANTAVITSPVNGMMIYDISNNCIRGYENGAWSNCLNGTVIPPPQPFTISCTGSQNSPAVFFAGVAYNGTATVPYIGGNGTSYAAGTAINSTGVTGLTATLQAGTLANGPGNLTYTITGTPSANGVANFAISLNGSSCTIAISSCGATLNGSFKSFMCYNLGVTGTQDPLSYQSGANNGSLYQWGRKTDGHEARNSATTTTAATNTDATTPPEVVGKFIITTDPLDWLAGGGNGARWGDGAFSENPPKATNDPCPAGYKVPSITQMDQLFKADFIADAPSTATQNTWTWTGNGYLVGNALYLPAAGLRVLDSNIFVVGEFGRYWSSTTTPGNLAYYFSFIDNFITPLVDDSRGIGYSVRCIAE